MRQSLDKDRTFISCRQLHYLLLAAIIFAVMLSYSNVIQGDLQFDDEVFINSSLADMGPPSFFSFSNLKNYIYGSRSLPQYSFALNYHFSGLEVASYHITNIVIHAFTAILLYYFTNMLISLGRPDNELNFDSRPFALFVTAIFALHPLQTESVSYIVQRSELLASFCYLGCLIALLGFTVRKGTAALAWWLASILLFVAGWGCKEIIITAPLAYFICVLYIGGTEYLGRAWKGLVPYCFGAVTLACIKLLNLRGSMEAGFDSYQPGVLAYGLTQLKVVVTYLRLFVFPVGQNIDHDINIITRLWSVEAAAYLVILLCITVGSIFLLANCHGKHQASLRLVGFGLLWFLVILLPTSSIIPIRDVMAEHRTYLPLAGLGIAFTAFSEMFLNNIKRIPGRSIATLIACVGLTVMLMYATRQRNLVWQTKLALWQDAAAKSPNKSRPHNNLGNAYLLLGNASLAANNYRTAIRLDPDNIEPYYNLALALKNLGRNDEALQMHRIFVNIVKRKTSAAK